MSIPETSWPQRGCLCGDGNKIGGSKQFTVSGGRLEAIAGALDA
jgi:hypothetical protein